MTLTMKLTGQKDKKIGVFGLGLTGCSVVCALEGTDNVVLCWDDSAQNRDHFVSRFSTKYLVDIKDQAWQNLDEIVISPGIPPSHKIFSLAKQYNIQISSDIEMFIEENPNAKIVIVTGTNGKSTTTALIGHILKQSKMDYHIGGNLGNPVLNLPFNAEGYILELSSFQIDLLDKFRVYISVLLNITPDHLDRYGTIEEYCKSKYKAALAGDIKIIGIDSDKSREFYFNLKIESDAKLIPISSSEVSTSGIKQTINCRSNELVDNFFNYETYDLQTSANLKGAHNRENTAASFAVCRSLGLRPHDIIEHIATFTGLKHRMQYLGTKNNISFYNDSKATNAISAGCSLATLDNVFWLAGGIFKEESLAPIDFALGKVRKAYIFGRDKILFAGYLKDRVNYEICSTMKKAFALAVRDAEQAREHSNILLAPACASYDQFKNFEDRGNQFIELYEIK